MKLNKETLKKLKLASITHEEYNLIVDTITKRFGEIVRLIIPKYGWYVYSNYDYRNESDCGHFDIQEYEDNICIGGDIKFPEPYCFSDVGVGYIPTRWLWTDDKEILKEFKQNVQESKEIKIKEKERAKQKRETLKQKKVEMRQIIESKLTKEELKYIKFK